MKALSIVAPNGKKIANGLKTLEIRRWRANLCRDEDLLIVENRRYLHSEGEVDPEGTAVAIVKIAAIRPFLAADVEAACASYHEDGWLAWELADIRPIPRLVTVIAARGIYEVELCATDLLKPVRP